MCVCHHLRQPQEWLAQGSAVLTAHTTRWMETPSVSQSPRQAALAALWPALLRGSRLDALPEDGWDPQHGLEAPNGFRYLYITGVESRVSMSIYGNKYSSSRPPMALHTSYIPLYLCPCDSWLPSHGFPRPPRTVQLDPVSYRV